MILISIYPKQTKAIKKGLKKYEFRKYISKKTKPKLIKTEYLAVYEIMPTGAITLILKVGDVFEDNTYNLWKRFGDKSGVSRNHFISYYHKKSRGIAIEIKDFLILKKPITLSEIRKKYSKFNPPQNYYQLSKENYPKLNKELIKIVSMNKF